jgi:NADPH:quinone reductase-like Zn-dependent oxidoreductase
MSDRPAMRCTLSDRLRATDPKGSGARGRAIRFVLFAQPQPARADAWSAIVALLRSGAIKPIVAKTFALAEAAEALRHLVEGRPFGRVVLTI